MVAPGKGPLAEMALKGSVAGMLAVVAGQFVGAGEFPTASFPVAVVWLLPRMGSQVGLQVGRLGVGLSAARMRTSVRRRSLPTPSASSALLRRRRSDVGGAEAQQRAADASDAAAAHGKEEIGELRRGRRRHERMVMRVVGMVRMVRVVVRVMVWVMVLLLLLLLLLLLVIHETGSRISADATGAATPADGMMMRVVVVVVQARVDHVHLTTV